MVQKSRASIDVIDCACVIHGDRYDWRYVERLYGMLQRNLTPRVQLHVYTEPSRAVPSHMIKHELEDCPAANARKRGWWYKMQLFNQQHFSGNLLYFDLDVVITQNLDWITDLPLNKLWAVRDFRYLMNEHLYQINSSVMWWNVDRFSCIWDRFNTSTKKVVNSYNGDQDFLDHEITFAEKGFFPDNKMTSWRWEAWEGGTVFPDRVTKKPEQGTILPDTTSVLIFHGQPKPHELLDDVVIKQHWF